MPNSYLDDFKNKYERPQVDGLIVGFSGIDPQRKPEGSGSSELSDEQFNAIQDIIQNEFNSFTEISGNCNCDWSILTDEQKKIVLSLIERKLETIKISYDGGEIDNIIPNDDEPGDDTGDDDDNQNQDSDDHLGDFSVIPNHEELDGLLGGNSNGHYHLTERELLKLAEYPDFCLLNQRFCHEFLSVLMGGDSNGHWHLTEDELKKLRKMIAAFFPDGSNEVVIKPVAPTPAPDGDDDPEGGSGGGGSGGGGGSDDDDNNSGNSGLPSGDPPGWSMKILPGGYEAHANSGKMLYGSPPNSKGYSGLFVRLSKNQVYCSDDLNNWIKATSYVPSSMYNSDYNTTQYIFTNGGIARNNSVAEFIPIQGDAKATSYFYYSYKTTGGGYGANVYNQAGYTKSSSHSQSTFVAGAYSEMLQCVILVDSANHMVARRIKGVTTFKKIEDSTNIITPNLGCAAWNPITCVFCITGKNGTSTSPDGETWTVNYDVPKNMKFLAFRDDLQRFFAWSEDDKLFYSSSDGINWDLFPSAPIPLDNVTAIDWSNPNGWYCAVGTDSAYAYFSKDLKHWISTTIRNNSPVTMTDVIFMPSTGLYVAMPDSGNYYYTFNPSDWTD